MRTIKHRDGNTSEVEDVQFADGQKAELQYCAATGQWAFRITEPKNQLVLQWLHLPAEGKYLEVSFEPRANN